MKISIKRILLFLLIFLIISVSITYILILQNDTKSPNTDSEKVDSKEIGIDLYGTYDQNDLVIKEVVEDYKGTEIKIPQIEGLKNLEVQSKINKEMRDTIYEEIKNMNSIEDSYVYVCSNFENIISLDYSVYEKEYSKRKRIIFNYELVNGEKIEFEDVFTKDADVIGHVRKAVYNALARYNSPDEDGIVDSDIASPDENRVYKVVNGFVNDKEKEFTIYPSHLEITCEDIWCEIEFVDVADDVVIYNKYATSERLYTKNDIGYKNIFTCADSNYEIFKKIEYGYLEDNLWYDITITKDYFPEELEAGILEKYNTFSENIYKEVYNELDEYRQKAKENKDKFYIVLLKPNLSICTDDEYIDGKWNYYYSNMAVSHLYKNIYEMPIELYVKTYKDKIINGYRNKYFAMGGGIYIDRIEEDDATFTNIHEKSLYNYMTGEKLTKLEDVFLENSNYMEMINSEARNTLIRNFSYSEEDANKLLETAEYEISGDSIIVETSSHEPISIYFSSLDKSIFKLFDNNKI